MKLKHFIVYLIWKSPKTCKFNQFCKRNFLSPNFLVTSIFYTTSSGNYSFFSAGSFFFRKPAPRAEMNERKGNYKDIYLSFSSEKNRNICILNKSCVFILYMF